jgi:hypothetical protein
MSSTAPNRINGYKFPPAPSRAFLEKGVWDSVLADIHERLLGVEAQRTELSDLIDDLSFNGQARLDQAIVPIIDNVRTALDALALEVASTAQANAAIIENFQQVTAVNLTELSQSVAAAETQLASIQQQFAAIVAGGVGADKITETGDRVFLTPAQKAAIGTLQTTSTAQANLITALAQEVDELQAKPANNGEFDGGTFG